MSSKPTAHTEIRYMLHENSKPASSISMGGDQRCQTNEAKSITSVADLTASDKFEEL